MKYLFLILTFIFLLNPAIGQNSVKNFYPKEILHIELNTKKENEIRRQNNLLNKKILTDSEQHELDTLLLKYGEVVESMWDIVDGGCSCYCGGGNYKVKSSSTLAAEKGITYTATKANDLNYQTAWIEGKDDEGIGEYIEYYFKNKSPRITKIIISNGYVKSGETWKNNNRIKKLKLIINNKLFGVLNLEDSRTDQVFDLGIFGIMLMVLI